ncbi:hypothetical protein C8J57DRAFT_1220450 [Mycena rebaudengoi]|nr:hypothetical protein C8J57DRAFT_1252039 [Mycena rebaudengoi]KAJ7279913.1 hypothetical protein C8J57DRAFT_1220450 [Mycena rebaudengoi]
MLVPINLWIICMLLALGVLYAVYVRTPDSSGSSNGMREGPPLDRGQPMQFVDFCDQSAFDDAVVRLGQDARPPLVILRLTTVEQRSDWIRSESDERWCSTCGADLGYGDGLAVDSRAGDSATYQSAVHFVSKIAKNSAQQDIISVASALEYMRISPSCGFRAPVEGQEAVTSYDVRRIDDEGGANTSQLAREEKVLVAVTLYSSPYDVGLGSVSQLAVVLLISTWFNIGAGGQFDDSWCDRHFVVVTFDVSTSQCAPPEVLDTTRDLRLSSFYAGIVEDELSQISKRLLYISRGESGGLSAADSQEGGWRVLRCLPHASIYDGVVPNPWSPSDLVPSGSRPGVWSTCGIVRTAALEITLPFQAYGANCEFAQSRRLGVAIFDTS